jgi:hypothetical protein
MTEWLKGNELQRRMDGGDLGGTMRLGVYPLGAAVERSRLVVTAVALVRFPADKLPAAGGTAT